MEIPFLICSYLQLKFRGDGIVTSIWKYKLMAVSVKILERLLVKEKNNIQFTNVGF